MQKTLIRLCILGCVLGALLSPAAAYCSKPGPAHDECHSVGSIQCQVGSSVHFSKSSWLKDTDFSHSCLADAGVNCASVKNAATPGNPTASCCSCYLYAKYCANKPGQFVTNKPVLGSDHTLLMPASACTGVENWDQPGCPGEGIWDEGEKLLSRAGKDATWGMAINPVSRRGQHQMHVHLSQVDKSLMAAIVEGYHQKHQVNFFVDCTQGGHNAKTLDNCKYSPTQCQYCQEVHIKEKQPNPSGATPFTQVYGPTNNMNKNNVLKASTLVLRLPIIPVLNKDTWAIVVNPTGPAECAFAATWQKACN